MKLYVVLWHDSERNSTRELTRAVTRLQALLGSSRNSHSKARNELIKAGLVHAEPDGLKGFIFHLCDPETAEPWPKHPTERVMYIKKSAPAAVSQEVPSAMKLNKPPKIDGAGISFPFGMNDLEYTAKRSQSEETPHTLHWDTIGVEDSF